MADPVRVFVSHHHSPEEDAFTARLVADLQAAGADVWVDDERITSDDFVRKADYGLRYRVERTFAKLWQLSATPYPLGTRLSCLPQLLLGRAHGAVRAPPDASRQSRVSISNEPMRVL